MMTCWDTAETINTFVKTTMAPFGQTRAENDSQECRKYLPPSEQQK